MARAIKDGTMLISIKTWRLHQIVEAHAVMDESTAEAKMVVLIDESCSLLWTDLLALDASPQWVINGQRYPITLKIENISD